ncbi:MAG TPA: ABC transporter ATP-binding protein [Kiloniellales bacterium]|nr:ABC transporter ATP-binding protein [Kiloniellales bacterium]
MAEAGASLLETRGVTMRFGGVVAVDQVNFRMADGELRCLIGPNGAGKSTFFKCLTRQYKPSAGQIFFRGEEITRLQPNRIARRGVGIKTQVPSVFDGLSVRQNIWLAASRRHRGREVGRAVDESLARIGLERVAGTLVGRLSHGERQWVELAMIMTSDPILVLLDEPAAGMTHEEVHRTAELIREINRTKSLIVVEHDMQFIRAIARRVTVFHQGKILIEDDVAEVLRNQQVRDVYLGKGSRR